MLWGFLTAEQTQLLVLNNLLDLWCMKHPDGLHLFFKNTFTSLKVRGKNQTLEYEINLLLWFFTTN